MFDGVSPKLLETNIMLLLHEGEQYAVKAEELLRRLAARSYDLGNVGTLRGVIRQMRRDGYLIASSQAGYYLPGSFDEAMQYIERQLREPSRDALVTARRQREIALRQFGGQYSLFGRPR